MSEPTAPGDRWRFGLHEAALVGVVAIACLIFQLWLPSTHVAESDYQAVAQILQTEAQPGDVVLLAPWWTERARVYVPSGLPVVGYQGCDRDALETHPRIWLLSQPSQPRAGLSDFMQNFGPGRTAQGDARAFGNLRLQLFTNGKSHPVVFDASERLPTARAYLQNPAGETRACEFDGHGFRCPQSTVATEWHEINFAPHHCIHFNPVGSGLALTLEFSQVPAADTLALTAGYIWDRGYFHSPDIGEARLTLDVNGQRSELPLPPPTVPLQRVEQQHTPEGATVKVSVTATNPNARDLCFELRGFRGTP